MGWCVTAIISAIAMLEVERILAECCEPCEQYRDGRCAKCGCRISASSMALINKIKMASEQCPLGKW